MSGVRKPLETLNKKMISCFGFNDVIKMTSVIDLSYDFWRMVRVIVNCSPAEVVAHPLYAKFQGYAQLPKKKGQFRMRTSSLPGLGEPNGKKWHSFDSVEDAFWTIRSLYEQYFRDSEDYWLLIQCMQIMLADENSMNVLQNQMSNLVL